MKRRSLLDIDSTRLQAPNVYAVQRDENVSPFLMAFLLLFLLEGTRFTFTTDYDLPKRIFSLSSSSVIPGR